MQPIYARQSIGKNKKVSFGKWVAICFAISMTIGDREFISNAAAEPFSQEGKMSIIKRSLSTSTSRQVDPFLSISDIFSDPTARFDIVMGSLNGPHGSYINENSEKAYFILEGTGTVYIGNESSSVSKYDFIFIPPNTPHGIKGDLKFLIITSPPFNPHDERLGNAVE